MNNEILQCQKIIFEALKVNSIKIASFANTSGEYPFVKFGEASKIIEDDFSRQIFINLHVISNQQSNVEVLNICDKIEQIFLNKNILQKSEIVNLNAAILPNIAGVSLVKTDLFQDDTNLFNAKLTIKFVVC